MKREESSLKGKKALWKKEKLLVISNFSFIESVFKKHILQTCKNKVLFGKGLMHLQKVLAQVSLSMLGRLTLNNPFFLIGGLSACSWTSLPHDEVNCKTNWPFYWARLWWARCSKCCHNDNSVYVSACISLFELVQTITSTIVDGFQINVTQFFSITCRCTIWNIHSRPKVKVTLEGQTFIWTITSIILNGLQYKFAQ